MPIKRHFIDRCLPATFELTFMLTIILYIYTTIFASSVSLMYVVLSVYAAIHLFFMVGTLIEREWKALALQCFTILGLMTPAAFITWLLN